MTKKAFSSMGYLVAFLFCISIVACTKADNGGSASTAPGKAPEKSNVKENVQEVAASADRDPQIQVLASLTEKKITNSWLTPDGVFFSQGDLAHGVLNFISLADYKTSQIKLRDPSQGEEGQMPAQQEFMSSDGKVVTTFLRGQNDGLKISTYGLKANGSTFAVEPKVGFEIADFFSGINGSSTDGKYIAFVTSAKTGTLSIRIFDTQTGQIINISDYPGMQLDPHSFTFRLYFIPQSHKIIVSFFEPDHLKEPQKKRFTFWDIDQKKILLELPVAEYEGEDLISNRYFTTQDKVADERIDVDLQTFSVKRSPRVLADPGRISAGPGTGDFYFGSNGQVFITHFTSVPTYGHSYHRTWITNALNNDYIMEVDVPQDGYYDQPGILNFVGNIGSLISPDEKLVLSRDSSDFKKLAFVRLDHSGVQSRFLTYSSPLLDMCKIHYCFNYLKKVTYSLDSKFVVLNYEFGFFTNPTPTGNPVPFYSHYVGFAHQIVNVNTGEILHESVAPYDYNNGSPDVDYQPQVEFFDQNKMLVREYNSLRIYSY